MSFWQNEECRSAGTLHWLERENGIGITKWFVYKSRHSQQIFSDHVPGAKESGKCCVFSRLPSLWKTGKPESKSVEVGQRRGSRAGGMRRVS